MRECESLSLILSCIFQVKEKKMYGWRFLRRDKNKNYVGSREKAQYNLTIGLFSVQYDCL